MDRPRTWQPSRIARRFTVALLAAALVFASGAEVLHASGTAKPLSTRLSKALALAQLDAANVSALVVDLDTGTGVFARNSAVALVPASTEKLPIALAALAMLGPDFRSQTLVLGSGERRDHVWDGDLFLKGHGDPTLRKRDLRRLARILGARGITRITGALVGDDSYFDAKRTAPGWKASFYKVYSPPISALVLDRARKRGSVADALCSSCRPGDLGKRTPHHLPASLRKSCRSRSSVGRGVHLLETLGAQPRFRSALRKSSMDPDSREASRGDRSRARARHRQTPTSRCAPHRPL